MAERQYRILEELLFLESSEDEEDVLFFNNFAHLRRDVPRIRTYIRDVVDLYNDNEFKAHFRVTRETCYLLVNLFEQSTHCPRGPPFGGVKPKTEHVIVYLRFARNQTVYRSIAELFGASISTVSLMIDNVMNFLVEDVGPNIIRFPQTDEEKQAVAEEFEQISAFPGVCGCIDGTFINICTPVHKLRSTYVNRHDVTSLTLQGICDAQLKFLDVSTGISGKIHDARTFTLSLIRNKVLQMGQNFHLLGDSAYPICENLLTPYRDYGNMTDKRIQFNLRFCATRVKIENAFGLLKQRWQQLLKTDMWRVVKTSKFIISCCVMHNLCIDRNDVFDAHNPFVDAEPPELIINDEARRLGTLKRDALARQFYL